MQRYNEIVRLKQQIDAEVEAAQQGMCGLAQGVSKHQFITVRMERMGILHEQLQGLIGDTEATQYFVDILESVRLVR